MSVFDRIKNRKRDLSWAKGFDAAPVAAPNYEAALHLSDVEIERITEKQMRSYDKAVSDFCSKTSLTALDMSFLMVAATLQTLRWAFMSNDKFRFEKAADADKTLKSVGDTAKNYEFVPASLADLISNHTVPYDAIARSERFKSIYPDLSTGLSGTTHRYKTLGHDPLAGLIVGTANIATNTLTVNDFGELFPSYHVVNQQIDAKTDLYHVMKWTGQLLVDQPEVVGASFIRQIVHSGTDVFTKQGLPLPIINVISPETSKFLVGEQIDTYSVTRGAALAILINKVIEMSHRVFFDPKSDDELIYEVRTRKILTYSNTLSSLLNVGYVALTRDLKRLDIGGILVTLWRLLNDRKKIQELQWEFINKTLDRELQREEDEVNQQLAQWGFSI